MACSYCGEKGVALQVSDNRRICLECQSKLGEELGLDPDPMLETDEDE